MKRTAILAGFVAVVLACVVDSEAFAQRFGRGGGFGRAGVRAPFLGFNGTSFSTIWDLYLRGDIPVPPYFALHPPVYYSYPVPRTYGYSPFAYPASVRTPEIVAAAEPETIINPYVPSSVKETKPSDDHENTAATKTRPKPLVVIFREGG